MSPKSYQKLKKILIDSHDLSGIDKQNYINHACESHPELASFIQDILSEDAREAEIFEQSVEVNYDNKPEETLDEINEKIVDYTIIKKIGSGGMGDVYQADQTAPVERQVALKLLKSIPNQKFLMSEMQILAQLNHPNIATLYDVGETTDERMFLVMELIEGDDIVTWCQKHQYNVPQKIRLFQQLCSGISFAHEKGIIHCDIKPANIQITQVNDNPILKIIDFGISQLFKKSTDQSYDILSGTPAYLSPEVLHAKGKILADTRRDVYALGILLHKLVVGKLPDNDEKGKNKIIGKDLMAIINKSKAHEMSERYANANNLNQDLNRFLNKFPITARERNWSYVVTRFVQRRFGVVVFSLALFMTLIGGFVAQAIQAKKAEQQAKIAIEQSIVAKSAQKEAEELTGFLMGLFDLSNPERSNQKQSSTEDLVNKANDELLAIVNPTLSDARFMFTIGSIFLRMDQLQKAQISIEKSLVIKKKLLPENHTEIIAGITQLGVIYRRWGKNDLAESNLNQALKLLQTQKQIDQSQLAFIHNHLGNLNWQTRHTDKAVSHHKHALAIRMKLTGKKEIADSYNNLGAIYLQNKQWDLSQKNLEKALDLYVQVYDESHPFVAYALQNLALVAEGKYQWNKAEGLYFKSYRNILKIYGKNHNKTLFSQKNLSIFYARIQKYDESIELRKTIITGYEAIGNDDQKISRSYWLARTYANSGDYASSIKQYTKTLNWLKKTPVKDKNLKVELLVHMAESHIGQKSYQLALQTLDRADKILKLNNNPQYHYNLTRLNTKAEVYRETGKTDLSIKLYNEVLSLSDSNSANNQEETINAYLALGSLQIQQEKYQSASKYFQSALKISEQTYDYNHRINANIFYQMALLEITQNHIKQAKQYLQQTIDIQSIIRPPNHSELIKSKKELEALDL